LTLILLAGGALMLRSFLALYHGDRVVDASRVLTVLLRLPETSYTVAQQRTAFYQRVEERLGAVPGVSLATVASARPFVGGASRVLVIADRAADSGERMPPVTAIWIGARYFDALAIRVLRGRAFTVTDGMAGQESAIVNQRFVDAFLAGRDPIGQRIRVMEKDADPVAAPWLTIVGVSPTVRQSVASAGRPVVYLPLRGHTSAEAAIVVGGLSNPLAAVTELRRQIAALDPDVTLFNVRPLAELLADSRLQHRLIGTLLAAFAVIALLLSTIGLYGVTAYAVLQRTHEIGVRIALGARASQVVWLFIRRSLLPLTIGLTLGLAGAFVVGRLLQGALVQISPSDPSTLAGIAAVLIAAALGACVLPARRAARLDPVIALRRE
jgi:putative ABC transport system permease protein